MTIKKNVQWKWCLCHYNIIILLKNELQKKLRKNHDLFNWIFFVNINSRNNVFNSVKKTTWDDMRRHETKKLGILNLIFCNILNPIKAKGSKSCFNLGGASYAPLPLEKSHRVTVGCNTYVHFSRPTHWKEK